MKAVGGDRSEATSSRTLGLPHNVFVLGVVSFLTDVSSEMMFTILPLFLLNVLRVGTPVIGLIEGIAESTATVMRISSGWLSDRLGRRKGLTLFGYGLSTVAKPFLYFAGLWGWGSVLAVRFTERLGKGIRTSPRDALIADSTPLTQMGKSFGFHRAMDTLGAVLGLSVAAGIVFLVQKGALNLAENTYQMLVLVGLVPAVLAVLLLLLFVHERRRTTPKAGSYSAEGRLDSTPQGRGSRAQFDARFKVFLGIMAVFSLGNSSDAFLVLRAQSVGLSVVHILLLFSAFNLLYAMFSLPAGLLSDKLGRKQLIVAGWAVYALSYLGFALASVWWHVLVAFMLYGLYYGATEGVARAFVADMVPAQRRGVAYGVYHGVVGVSILPASIVAGWLWHLVGPSAPFLLGAGLAAVAALFLWVLIR